MTTRTEPSIGTPSVGQTLSQFFGGKQSLKDPAVLVTEALQTFTTAQQQIEAAQEQIQAQMAEDQVKIDQATARIQHASTEHSKLSRIADKIADLLS